MILVGMTGAGKTTLGKALSKELGLAFYDLDEMIEQRYHRTINTIWDRKGEEGFRKIEQRMLREAAEWENIILATGGGTPEYENNMDLMNEKGETVYLKASPNTLREHLKKGKEKRPLLKNKNEKETEEWIVKGLREREPYYNKAKYRLNVNTLDTKEKINQAAKYICKMLNLERKNEKMGH